MSKPIYLGMSVLEIRKTVMYRIWYDHIKPRHQDKTNLCYIDTDRFIETLEMMLRKDFIHHTKKLKDHY